MSNERVGVSSLKRSRVGFPVELPFDYLDDQDLPAPGHWDAAIAYIALSHFFISLPSGRFLVTAGSFGLCH